MYTVTLSLKNLEVLGQLFSSGGVLVFKVAKCLSRVCLLILLFDLMLLDHVAVAQLVKQVQMPQLQFARHVVVSK